MRFGICCSPQLLGYPGEALHENIAKLRDAGAEYLEFAVGATTPEGEPGEFAQLQAALVNAPLRVEAFNSFLPAHHRITGPDVNLNQVMQYCRVALSRCKALGANVVVLGSAGARRVPEGFDKSEAEKQFVAFCRELAPIAEDNDITICIEPLNRNEDNLILSVQHGARIVDEVAHPSIQLLADLYHIEIEGESLANVAAANGRLRHAHLADVGRVAPGYAREGEADFKGFFAALAKAEYNESSHAARCSFEGKIDDIFEQTGPMLKLLRQRLAEAAA